MKRAPQLPQRGFVAQAKSGAPFYVQARTRAEAVRLAHAMAPGCAVDVSSSDGTTSDDEWNTFFRKMFTRR